MDSVPAVELMGINRRFGAMTALSDVTLSIARGEFFSLLGPSGCGKTTLLRIIAGLDIPDAGSLRLGGREMLHVPAHARQVNTVFQSYALFPHLSVRDNIAFGLRMKKISRAPLNDRVSKVMDMVRIAGLEGRKPAQLSGGEKQRVALARALVNEPEVLLLDEPLGALDLKLRKELQQELRALQRRTGISFIYVTHDQDEALSMSDRIAVMDRGEIVQAGSSRDLYERPRTRFVARFLGGCNLLPATVCNRDGNAITVTTPVGKLKVNTVDPRQEFTLAIRPERIAIGSTANGNNVQGTVSETTYTGAETHSVVCVANETLRVVSINGSEGGGMIKGACVEMELPADALIVLED